MNCTVCNSKETELLYKSVNGSISSICKVSKENISVFYCLKCSHTFTKYNIDYKSYYNKKYNILTNSEEEDQIYKVVGNTKIYRTEHQYNLLIEEFNIKDNTKILDYGCAKSNIMKMLFNNTNCKPYLFDISDNYIPYWKSFTNNNYFATHNIPRNWEKKFEIITSYFSLEHISELNDVLKNINFLLQENGIFYFIVPNFLVNIADFIVNEHINHFTKASISYLLFNKGFDLIKLDTESYYGAIIVKAQKTKKPHKVDIKKDTKEIKKIAEYWYNIDEKINIIEENLISQKVAIYGSGFYGSLIYSQLKDKNKIICFLDENPFRQKEKLFSLDIKSPHILNEEINEIIVGLNPNNAKDIIQNSKHYSSTIRYYYL